ncbi:hypothetical protein EPK99_25100 [Neorhizobium lilium]|uniref:Uncharacterized protein n=1 Tax=Neorhizobium lilium TaxID=2503024 RepID=A0A3S3TTJ4_9HYPH|nr:hypothetical protein EPK99_25100 [Neorhizobium lilium]
MHRQTYSMSRKSVYRFCVNDMRKNKSLSVESYSERSRHALSVRRSGRPHIQAKPWLCGKHTNCRTACRK